MHFPPQVWRRMSMGRAWERTAGERFIPCCGLRGQLLMRNCRMAEGLKRALTLPQLIIYAVGTMVGAGIYSVIAGGGAAYAILRRRNSRPERAPDG